MPCTYLADTPLSYISCLCRKKDMLITHTVFFWGGAGSAPWLQSSSLAITWSKCPEHAGGSLFQLRFHLHSFVQWSLRPLYREFDSVRLLGINGYMKHWCQILWLSPTPVPFMPPELMPHWQPCQILLSAWDVVWPPWAIVAVVIGTNLGEHLPWSYFWAGNLLSGFSDQCSFQMNLCFQRLEPSMGRNLLSRYVCCTSEDREVYP